MKKIMNFVAAVAIILCAATSVEAKSNKKAESTKVETKVDSKIVTVTFKTDIDCPSCEAKIMKVLPYQKGVKNVVVDIKKKTVMVKYDKTKTTEETIKVSLKKLDVQCSI